MAVCVDESALGSVTPVFICVHCDTESDRAGFSLNTRLERYTCYCTLDHWLKESGLLL